MRMAKQMKVLALALATMGGTAAGNARQPETTTQVAATPTKAATAGAEVVDAFHAALRRGDTAAAAAHLADDALIYESGNPERGKAQYASHHLAADAAFAKATSSAVTRRSGDAAGDFAWVSTEGTTKGTYRDRVINSASTETMVLRRQGGAWRIVHIHWSSANVK